METKRVSEMGFTYPRAAHSFTFFPHSFSYDNSDGGIATTEACWKQHRSTGSKDFVLACDCK